MHYILIYQNLTLILAIKTKDKIKTLEGPFYNQAGKYFLQNPAVQRQEQMINMKASFTKNLNIIKLIYIFRLQP